VCVAEQQLGYDGLFFFPPLSVSSPWILGQPFQKLNVSSFSWLIFVLLLMPFEVDIFFNFTPQHFISCDFCI
jgi:hypothetical protein